jgi:hypothetical protein
VRELNALRVIQAGGALLSIIMALLLFTVAATQSTHIVWILLCLAGCGIFAGARWLDERAR